ncbi:Tautomerase/MIF superfamily [Mycena alexandri]|uniref:L-dopachrome isomerase n=1 Tax=Mycena alexandri TaxID=1745969 RepID=A0AAD6TD21_9AGAR|nr:Tautomerase/MIF superfamily [Mycena alexandri]
MPSLELMINVQVPDEKEFALQLSKIGTKALGKPEGHITVSITYNKTLTFAGTFEPAFALSVMQLNGSVEANEKLSAAFSEFLKERLNIPNDRGYITFVDPGPGYVGFKGTTFATIMAKK